MTDEHLDTILSMNVEQRENFCFFMKEQLSREHTVYLPNGSAVEYKAGLMS